MVNRASLDADWQKRLMTNSVYAGSSPVCPITDIQESIQMKPIETKQEHKQINPNLNRMLCHGGQDIEDLKIYHDTKIEQYKVRHYCDRCGLDLGCFCYETVEDAIYACSEVSWSCMRSILRDVWRDYEMWEEIDVICETDLEKLVFEDYDEDCDRSKEIEQIIDAITEEQASKILDMGELDAEYWDDNYTGEMCRL